MTAGAEVDFHDDPAAFVAEYPQEYYPDIPIRPLGPTPADAVEQLRPLVELGVTHFMIYPSSLRTLARFSAEVAPVLAGVKARTGDETFT